MTYQKPCPELDFATEDGVLRVGPVWLSRVEHIRSIMAEIGVTTGADESIRIVQITSDLVYVVAAGEDVAGYFLEEFGVEAPSESVGAFVLRCCPPGTPISIRGHYHPDDETKIASEMTAVHNGVSVTMCDLRMRVRDGEFLRLSAPDGSTPFPVIDCAADHLAPEPIVPELVREPLATA